MEVVEGREMSRTGARTAGERHWSSPALTFTTKKCLSLKHRLCLLHSQQHSSILKRHRLTETNMALLPGEGVPPINPEEADNFEEIEKQFAVKGRLWHVVSVGVIHNEY